MTTPVVAVITLPPKVIELTAGPTTVIEVVSSRAELDVTSGPTTVIEVLEQPPAVVEVLTEPTPVYEFLFPGPRGPQGIPGPPGTDSYYVHEQSTALSTWIIVHNLGRKPSVSLVINGRLEHTDVEYPSLNQVTVIWPSPTTGAAHLN